MPTNLSLNFDFIFLSKWLIKDLFLGGELLDTSPSLKHNPTRTGFTSNIFVNWKQSQI